VLIVNDHVSADKVTISNLIWTCPRLFSLEKLGSIRHGCTWIYLAILLCINSKPSAPSASVWDRARSSTKAVAVLPCTTVRFCSFELPELSSSSFALPFGRIWSTLSTTVAEVFVWTGALCSMMFSFGSGHTMRPLYNRGLHDYALYTSAEDILTYAHPDLYTQVRYTPSEFGTRVDSYLSHQYVVGQLLRSMQQAIVPSVHEVSPNMISAPASSLNSDLF
jgi:hypothetical protein